MAWSRTAVLLVAIVGRYSMVTAVVVGLDAGTAFVKVGVGRHGEGVSLALNGASKRKTPWVLAFHPEGRRLIGDDAVNLGTRYPRSTIPFPSRFLGKRFSVDDVTLAQNMHAGYALVEDPARSGSILLGQGTRADEAGQGHDGLAPEEAVGALIRHSIRDIGMRKGDKMPEQVVMTVPAYANQATRQAVLDAFVVAGIPHASLIHDHAAVAIKYAMDRTFTNKPVNVMFYDHGAGGLKVSIVSFHNVNTTDVRRQSVVQLRVRAVAFDERVGGVAFDAIVADMITKHAEAKKPGCTTDDRSQAKIQTEAKKARTVLSANKEYQYKIDGLGDDTSVSGQVQRADFEEAAESLFQHMLDPVKAAFRDSGLNATELEAVELVGGAFRMPKVQAILSEYLPPKQMRTSLNGDEAAALGATYYAAFLAGYNIRGFNMIDIVPRSIVATVGSSPLSTIAEQQSALPMMMSEALKNVGASENFTVVVKEDTSETCQMWSVQPSSLEKVSERLAYFKVDRSGLAILQGVEDFTSGKGSELQQPVLLNISLLSHGVCATPAMLKQYVVDRKRWDDRDAEIRKDADARNRLESFIFDTKAKVEGEDFVKVTSEEQRAELIKSLDALEEWLFDTGANAKANVYGEKRDEAEKLLAPHLLRVSEHTERPRAVRKATTQLKKVAILREQLLKAANETTANANETETEVVVRKKSIEESAKDLQRKGEEFAVWMAALMQKQNILKVHESPVLTSSEIQVRIADLLAVAARHAQSANLTASQK